MSTSEREGSVRVDTSFDSSRANLFKELTMVLKESEWKAYSIVCLANTVGVLEGTTVERDTHHDLASSSTMCDIESNSGISRDTSTNTAEKVSYSKRGSANIFCRRSRKRIYLGCRRK